MDSYLGQTGSLGTPLKTFIDTNKLTHTHNNSCILGRYLLVTRSLSGGDNNEFVNKGKSHGLDGQSILNELLAYQFQTFVPTVCNCCVCPCVCAFILVALLFLFLPSPSQLSPSRLPRSFLRPYGTLTRPS